MTDVQNQPSLPDPNAAGYTGDMAEVYQQTTGAPISKGSGNDNVSGPPNQQDSVQGFLTQEEAIEIYQQSTGMSIEGVKNLPGAVNQGNTINAVKYRESQAWQQYDTPPNAPKLPYSSAPAPETSGNQWLNTAAMNKFYAAMRDRAHEQMFMQLLGAQNAILAQKSIEETGRDKAESQLIEGMETFVKELVAGIVAVAGAIGSAYGLAQSSRAFKDNQTFNNQLSGTRQNDGTYTGGDPTHGMNPAQKTRYNENEARIKQLRDQEEAAGGAAADPTHIRPQKLTPDEKVELNRREQEQSDLMKNRDDTHRLEYQNKTAHIQAQVQLIQQITQAVTSLSNAVFDLLISFERARQTMDDTTNQLNQAFLDSQQKSQQSAVDDFNQAIQNMVDTSRQYAQSISFKAA